MKLTFNSMAQRLSLWLSILVAMTASPFVDRAQAGLALEMNVVRYHQYGYYFFPNMSTNTVGPVVPFGDYWVTSSGYPTNGAWQSYRFDTNGFSFTGGGNNGFGDFDGMNHELTNGLWSVAVTNTATTNIFRFKVTANIKSNDLPYVNITFPTDGSVNVTNHPTYTWQDGPTNYNGIVVYELNNSATLPVTQTSWLSPRVLYQGLNSLTVHYDSNSVTAVVSSAPTNSAGQLLTSGWTSTAHLQDYSTSQFTVGTVDPNGTSHSLVAHYAWNETNNDGSASGLDSSGNGYDMNFGGGFGSQGGVNSTTTAETGARAIQFHNGNNSSGGFVGWNPTPTNLLKTLAGSFSVSCWIKTTQSGAGGWDQAPAYYGAGIVSADNGGQANDLIPLALTGSKVGFNTGGPDEDVTLNSIASVNDGNFHHIVVTRNQATGQKIIYIDGALDSFSSGVTNLLSDPQLLTVGALSDARQSDASSASYYNGFDGIVDDLQIYSGVLSSNEVAQLFTNPGSTAPDISGGHENVAHYAFEDGTSTFQLGLDSSPSANNLSGYSYWGQVHTNATDAVAGTNAVRFFGTSAINANDQVRTNLNAVLAGSFSFSAWVKTTASRGNDSDNAFFGATIFWAYNDHNNTNDTIPLAITGSKAAFTTRDHLGNFNTLHSITSVNDGSYHLVTVTRNQSTGEKKIYVDGAFEGSEIGTTEPLNGNDYYLSVGGSVYSSYTGLLDEFQIYSGVLSSSDVAYLYANPGATVPDISGGSGGPVVHYDFDEATVIAADVSGNNNNIIHAGNFGGSGPTTNSDAIAGSGSISFDGSSYLTASPSLLPTLAREFSVSVWVKTSQSFGNEGDLAWQGAGVICADSPNSGAKDLIPIALTGGQVAFNVGDGFSDDTLNSSATVNDNTWHHIVVTRSRSTGNRQIFIDGTLDSSSGGTTNLLNTPALLTIGAKSDASVSDPSSPDFNGSNGYEGLLDDIQIYDRVLNANEVAYLHNHPGATVAGISNAPYPVDLNLQFNIVRSQDNNLGEIFGGGVSFNLGTTVPTTTNRVSSPNNYFIAEKSPFGGFTSGAILSSLGEVIHEFTNGFWKAYINWNSPTQQVYSFQISISGLDTNLLKAVKVFSPINGASNIATNPTFHWVGPSNFTTLTVDLLSGPVAGLPIAATNWASAPKLNYGPERFDVSYTSNNFPGITFTTPLDSSSNSVRTWTATANLNSVAFISFIVEPNALQLTNPATTSTNFQFSFLSQAGVTHAVQYRTNLISGLNWQTYSNVTGDGTLKTIAVPLSIFSPAQQGFIRVSTQ